ncbi:isochorismate synthase [Cytobacillus spongiae]|uniref:isochorismate synthase n=1 Tax=Cytobacillus spongiae TaxID=2901381 RepID=UPI001F00310E|nr:isochorismate synthase [Cytobacillus spongiae]UII55315.1 isochorismate synthase [Cytobacillus spongiae]
MVTIQDTELKEGILKGIERARNFSKSILVSEVHQIEMMDPLSFYAAGKENFFGERFFWKDPSDETTIIGIGICKQIQSDQASDRFFHVEEEWARLNKDSLVDNSFQLNGTGPTMFGGFSFDPLKERTELWSKFSHTLFHVPKYMLTHVNGQSYLTTNVICTKHDDASLFEKIEAERRTLLTNVELPINQEVPMIKEAVEIEPSEWKDTVSSIVKGLKTGPIKKVVLARELRLQFNHEFDIESVLQKLYEEQRQSYIFAFESNGDCFLGASPERLVKKNGDEVFSTCLAGSTPRGKNKEDDELLGEQLLSDQKNLVEHQYVVDMIKTAMKDECIEVHLPDQPQLMKMRDIQHLYTPVTGKTQNDTSLLRLVKRLHPTPALGGLPRMEALEKIREVEQLDRGYYAAPLGWIDYQGNGEYAVAIRSALIQKTEASLFAGCGVVEDSNAESEYLETKIKFRPMLSALGGSPK